MADIATQIADRAAELYKNSPKNRADFMASVNRALDEFNLDSLQKAAVRKNIARQLGRRGNRRKKHLKNIATFLQQQESFPFDTPSTR